MVLGVVKLLNAVSSVVNPQHMREDYGIVILCVCVSVCLSVTKITVLYVANKVPLGFSWHFQPMHFVENVFKLFKSSGDIC